MSGVAELQEQHITVGEACAALGVKRATYYRWRTPRMPARAARRPTPARALSSSERAEVLELLHSERFVDRSPAQVVATLLDDEARYLCSTRTMYRILAATDEIRERRNQCRRPSYARPELVATGPNEVWTWDLTKLRGPDKWVYYYLYVVLDLYSRMVVAWMLAHRESGALARELFAQAADQQGIAPGALTIHADRGSAPTAKTLAQLFANLGVEPSFSRPQVSNDNPFSESQFKTLKYAPGYPDRFGSYEDALAWCRRFVPSYNGEHRHSSLSYLTPRAVHYGEAQQRLEQRSHTLAIAYAAHPERFPHGMPKQAVLPAAVWINPPEDQARVEHEIAASENAHQ